MTNQTAVGTREALLKRKGLVFVRPVDSEPAHEHARATALELAELGYVPSARLYERLERLPVAELTRLHRWMLRVLSRKLGADRKHVPLFRRFPDGVPGDTFELWKRKVLSHFLQSVEQPCLFCDRNGTTHVLRPCYHVVCDHCFDGSNYTACPVCEHHVDRSSPFFSHHELPQPRLSEESVTFTRLDLGEDLEAEARPLLVSLCEREQALSPTDAEDFAVLLKDYGERVLEWLPDAIPVRENVAMVFGTLFRSCDPAAVLPVARSYMTTTTDVLRFIAAYSRADPSLQQRTEYKMEERLEPPSQFWVGVAHFLRVPPPGPRTRHVATAMRVNRFRVAPLPRPLRRALLELLDGLDSELLIEDMLRHQSYWVWVGKFLHPHEYADRFPNVARAFATARKKAPDGTLAPRFAGYHARLEAAVRDGDSARMTEILLERPGELARRFDHALRIAGDDEAEADRVLAAFLRSVPAFATPTLLTLRSVLPTRTRLAKVRLFFPKGQVASGVSASDGRPTLSPRIVEPAVQAVETELLRRFAEHPAFDTCIIDEALRDIVAPFNERTASEAAVSIPRGSRVAVPSGKVARLFLHWCEPVAGGETTDLDLSVGLYDERWRYLGVCSYYQLKFPEGKREPVAASSGDLQDAPHPDGATEFVDLYRDRALSRGVRYAVMVVNSYYGLPFSLLDRVFAGVMLRGETYGPHFDPRTVELKFSLTGNRGIYLPLVFDVREETLHWLDIYSRGEFEFNNVESSRAAIAKVCPETIDYFASGVRASMYDLALLHAAARGRRVIVRGPETHLFERRADEDARSFLARISAGAADTTDVDVDTAGAGSTFAALYHGDIDLPDGAVCYALFRERVTGTIAASDLIS